MSFEAIRIDKDDAGYRADPANPEPTTAMS